MYLIITDNVITAKVETTKGFETVTTIPVSNFTPDMVGSKFISTDEQHNVSFETKPNNSCVFDKYVMENGEWVNTLTDEKMWSRVRAERDVALTTTDWTQVNDVEISETKVNEFKAWRSSLRSLPQDYTSPYDAYDALTSIQKNKPQT